MRSVGLLAAPAATHGVPFGHLLPDAELGEDGAEDFLDVDAAGDFADVMEGFAEVKGDWVGWNFRFLGPEKEELGLVTKKWAGLGKELFTSADNYIVSIDDSLEDQPVAKMLLLAAALAIDIVYYEHQG